MAKPILSTNYKDDILNVSTEGKRKYRMNYNEDGTVSFDDVTPYDQTGSDFGAVDINLTNEAVNQSADAGKIIDDPDTAEATTEKGYMAGVQLFNHVNNSIGDISGFITDTYDSIGAYIQYCVDNGYLPDINNNPLIPEMTSNSTPSGVASASDEATYNSVVYYAYHAFADDNLWWHSGVSVKPMWISYKFDTPKVVKKFTLENVYDESAGFVNSFKLQASNDNSTWVDLDTYTNSNVKGAKSTFNVSNESSYLYYRIYVVSIHDSIDYVRIKRIQMYGT